MPKSRLIIQHCQQNPHQFQTKEFDFDHWQSLQAKPLAGGRGASQKIEIAHQSLVLRQYRRGGLMARLSRDLYLWTGLYRSRPWREQRVMQHALEQGLPVAECMAFKIEKYRLFYRAAIITRFIPHQGTLASCLFDDELETAQWQRLGQLIRTMHQAGINHADLNANNILLNKDQKFYLIDFDKARIMSNQGSWTDNNTKRLLRSLHKIKRQRSEQELAFHFETRHWEAFQSGYR